MPKTKNLFRNLPCTKGHCTTLQVAKGLCRLHYTQAYRKSRSTKPCSRCGTGILPEYTLCQTCQRTGPKTRFCADCGVRISHSNRRESVRCWACHVKRLDNAPKRICSVPGCQKPHQARGYCLSHYVHNWRSTTRNGRRSDTYNRAWIAKQPCQLCGYNRMRSHVHRLRKQGDYVVGNMVALCARCHDEVHTGLTPCPEPLIPSL